MAGVTAWHLSITRPLKVSWTYGAIINIDPVSFFFTSHELVDRTAVCGNYIGNLQLLVVVDIIIEVFREKFLGNERHFDNTCTVNMLGRLCIEMSSTGQLLVTGPLNL